MNTSSRYFSRERRKVVSDLPQAAKSLLLNRRGRRRMEEESSAGIKEEPEEVERTISEAEGSTHGQCCLEKPYVTGGVMIRNLENN